MPARRISLEIQLKRFKSSNGCFEWTGYLDKDGYGKFKHLGKSLRPHRVMFEVLNGPIPSDMVVMHTCDNPKCINPKHLRLGDARSNVADKVRKQRQARGETQAGSKLTSYQVVEIRERYASGHTVKEIAKDYPVRLLHIYTIINRKAWKHIH